MVVQSWTGELQGSLARNDLTIDELVGLSNEWLERLAPRQSRYKVRERADVRTIRYYTAQKLLPRPVGYDGGRARYTGAHLTRLLLIKKLQAEHHTLQRISSVLLGASDDEVLRRLLGGADERSRSNRDSEPPPPGGLSLQRFSLPHGGSVDVPRAALADPAQRKAIAQKLESLARSFGKIPEKAIEN